MTELDEAIKAAFACEGQEQAAINKVYLLLLRTLFFVPVEKNNTSDEPFVPLFTVIEGKYFMLVFDQLERLEQWAGEYFDRMGYVEVKGMEVVKGISEGVFLCVNVGGEMYKEFSPEEVERLKRVAARIEGMMVS